MSRAFTFTHSQGDMAAGVVVFTCSKLTTWCFVVLLSIRTSVMGRWRLKKEPITKLGDGSRALLAFITNLTLFSLFAPRLGSYCGITDIPCLCLFSLKIQIHTKETKIKCLPASSTDSPRSSSSVCALFVGVAAFFHPNTAKSSW